MAADHPSATVHKHTQTHRRRSRQREQVTHGRIEGARGSRKGVGGAESNTHIVLCGLRRSVVCVETKRRQETMHKVEVLETKVLSVSGSGGVIKRTRLGVARTG